MSYVEVEFHADPIAVTHFLDLKNLYAYSISFSLYGSSVVLSSADASVLISYLTSNGIKFSLSAVRVIPYNPRLGGLVTELGRFPDAKYVRIGFNNTLIIS